jgi:4-hydroxybenzoate polyprenyltransferase
VIALIRCTHPIPCLAVSSFAGLIAFAHSSSLASSLSIFAVVLLQQISVGLSNDWLDYKRDLAAGRMDKPAANGIVSLSTLRALSLFSAGLAQLLAFFFSPVAAAVMFLMLLSGWVYNLGMKTNWSSAIPYAVGFGALPVFAAAADPNAYWPPTWIVAVAALLGIAAHFANALPDREADQLTGVKALPHILGQRISALVIAGSAMLATVITVTQATGLSAEMATGSLLVMVLLLGSASLLTLKPTPPRVVFPLLMVAALVNVILLLLGGRTY